MRLVRAGRAEGLEYRSIVESTAAQYVGCYDLAGVCRTIILFLLILI